MDCSADTPTSVATPELIDQQVVKSTDTIKNNCNLIENCSEKRFSMKIEYQETDDNENVTGKGKRLSMASATTTTSTEGDIENGNVINEEADDEEEEQVLCNKVNEMNVINW
jgi:hypothetical protein